MRRFSAPHAISAAYLLIGGLYIAFSDRAVAAISEGLETLSELQTYKGWGFILITGLLLFAAMRAHDKRQRRALDDLKQVRDEARRHLEHSHALLRELHHRVKNNLQLILSMLRLGTAYHGDASSETLMNCLHDRIFAIALVHEHVYKANRTDTLPVGPFVKELSRHLAQLDASRRVSVSVEAHGDVVVGLDDAVPVGIIVQEAVRNAIEHAFPSTYDEPSPQVSVRVHPGKSDGCVIEIRDNGIGFDRERTQLQLGFVFMEAVSKQVSGELEVTSNDAGTVVRFATAESIPE